jgi:hypothetical protein
MEVKKKYKAGRNNINWHEWACGGRKKNESL